MEERQFGLVKRVARQLGVHDEIVETHSSYVLLTDEFAFKIKKEVNFGFLDFSTLDKRKEFCFKELLLNIRFSKGLYLGVVAITEDNGNVAIVDALSEVVNAVEYAVKMRKFDRSQEFDKKIHRNMRFEEFSSLARSLSNFYMSEEGDKQSKCTITNLSNFPVGSPDTIYTDMKQNFDQISSLIKENKLKSSIDETYMSTLQLLNTWSFDSFEKLKDVFLIRKTNGFVKDCHGDLHLGNITIFDGKPTAFDCIEFNDEFRIIDVAADVGFLIMDLLEHSHSEFASEFLNEFLLHTGDYELLKVLPFYIVYRAMVRAKVALYAAISCHNNDLASHISQSYKYLAFSSELILLFPVEQNRVPNMILMHGVSGSGKSFVAHKIAQCTRSIIIKSDAERKRLLGKGILDSTESERTIAYSKDHTRKTYERLLILAESILLNGFPVIVDATFLDWTEETPFISLSQRLGSSCYRIECEADQQICHARIRDRSKSQDNISEATESILDKQISNLKLVSPNDNLVIIIKVDTTNSFSDNTCLNLCSSSLVLGKWTEY